VKISVKQKDGFHFIGSGAEYPGELLIDAAAHVGGKGRGFRPPELLFYSIAACMGIHTYEAIVKAGKSCESIQVERTGSADEHPWLRHTAQFTVRGLSENVRDAIDVALGKTCSIAAMINRVAPSPASQIV
jgi:putative redox protein